MHKMEYSCGWNFIGNLHMSEADINVHEKHNVKETLNSSAVVSQLRFRILSRLDDKANRVSFSFVQVFQTLIQFL